MPRIGWVSCATLALAGVLAAAQDGDWPAYGRDPGGERFSPLDAIRRDNVATLQVAWTFRTGDAYEPKNGRPTRVRSHAALRRRHALSEHARRTRHRARSGDRPAALGVRREVAARHRLRRFRQPRRLDVAARRRASHLRRDDRRAAHRARRHDGQADRRLWRSGHRRSAARDCALRRPASPTTRSPLRPRSSATPSSSARPSPTARRNRIRAARCAGFDAITGTAEMDLGSGSAGPIGHRSGLVEEPQRARAGGANAWSVIVGRSGAQPRLRADQQPEPRLLRR